MKELDKEGEGGASGGGGSYNPCSCMWPSYTSNFAASKKEPRLIRPSIFKQVHRKAALVLPLINI